MEIKAIKFCENGYMTQGFAFGGEEGAEKYDSNVKYRSSLQNYLIDTGDEVILVDTGLPKESPEIVPDEKTVIYVGTKIKDYVTNFEELGYTKEQVTKIILTHKHHDHSGELRSFPNAKIYVSRTEADMMGLEGDNIVRVDFTDGPYYNFEKSQKIADGIYMIQAEGHTKGNSIAIAEDGGISYMFQGDVTYTDEALYENKLSVFFEDIGKARHTLDNVREFVKNHPTVYLSTHTPLGYENLESKKIMDLDNPPESIPPKEIFIKEATGKYVCAICGYVYDPKVGDPDNGIPAGTPFEELPEDWHCPRCKQGKDKFNRA